ncbi:MAG: alpha-galactosidase [Eubacteriales bacterium]|nr:alpha-galactosidase [Eubacteriales bacterium]
MGIAVHEQTGVFHLYNEKISYIMKRMANGQMGQLYYGRRLRDREDFPHLVELAHRDMAPCTFDGDTTFSLEHLKQEYPAFGSGDMRYPAYELERENGSRISYFRYRSFEIYQGKRGLMGLPAVYTEQAEEAWTLELYLEDEVIHTGLTLVYTIFEELPVIIRSARFEHHGQEKLWLNRAMSLSLDLPDCQYEMVELTGAWCRERYVEAQKLHHGIQSIHSMRGHSSHQFNPFLALKRKETDEFQGEVIGVSLVYSGNFLGQVEVDTMNTTRLTMGIHPQGFRWPLQRGEVFQTPEAVMVYSTEGMNGMSQVYHRLYRRRLARGYWRDRERPILINNWEATYMDFNQEKILTIAKKAKELGIELFVLDDGWFGRRNDDTSSLGDWYPNLDKLPDGIAGLAENIVAMGMRFGLWFEPEMISRRSNLYEAHPEWVLGSTDRPICAGRHQYVLDFSRDEVVQYIGDMIAKILDGGLVSYIKWDMNRSISDLFSAGMDAEYQGTVYHRQILGVYKLYERLTTQFPQVLFESCASGGARFDPGILHYAPQGWASDDTDGVERIRIQYGTTYVYPVSSIGSHVSAIPNHQTHRNVPLETRAVVAYFGTFGYELDLNLLSGEEQQQVAEQIRFMKQHRAFLHSGTFYRLLSPFEGNEAAWMVVSEDRKKAIVAYFRILQPANAGFSRLKLTGLVPELDYTIDDRDYTCYGDELMQVGLILSDAASGVRTSPVPQGDYLARMFVVEAK